MVEERLESSRVCFSQHFCQSHDFHASILSDCHNMRGSCQCLEQPTSAEFTIESFEVHPLRRPPQHGFLNAVGAVPSDGGAENSVTQRLAR